MGCIRVSKDTVWFNKCPSNVSMPYEYILQGVLADLARDLSRQLMHLFVMARTFEIFTNDF